MNDSATEDERSAARSVVERLLRGIERTPDEPIDVLFVQMPLARASRPSLALGLLSALLAEDGRLNARVLHADIAFHVLIGAQAAPYVQRLAGFGHLAEWIFAGAAFADEAPDPDKALRVAARVCQGLPDPEGALGRIRRSAEAFTTALAEGLLTRTPRIVGCSSIFHQQTASLALLRQLKKTEPSVVTMLGGPNVEAEMGRVTHRSFAWVDYIVSGDADDLIADLCALVAEVGVKAAPGDLPYGVLGPCHRGALQPAQPPRAIARELDRLPPPLYDDYLEQLATLGPFDPPLRPSLLFEASRGCWWGRKHLCTFCGLNGAGLTYRKKSGPRVVEELEELTTRYQTTRLQAVDNILDMAAFDTFLPELSRRRDGWALFFETKANLRQPQLAALASAGVMSIQPGLESLHDGVLELMDKGTTAAQNVALLKWAAEQGIYVLWNIIAENPGEDDAWYAEMAALVPDLHHLQPPMGVNPLSYDRFSVYQSRPDDFGLELRPHMTYGLVYPLGDDALMELAYTFQDSKSALQRALKLAPARPGLAALRTAVSVWIDRWCGPNRPRLVARHRPAGLLVEDSRSRGETTEHRLQGDDALLLTALDSPATLARAAERSGLSLSDANAALDRLRAMGLVAELQQRFVSLPLEAARVSGSPPANAPPPLDG